MKKLNINLPFGFIIFGIIVVGILAYISLLGENQQINRVVTSYFDRLKEGEYLDACESFSSDFQNGQPSGDEQRMNFNFLLESALLTQYNLIDQPEYKVKLKRSNFWIPYISDDVVHVSVLLRKKDKRWFSFSDSNDQGRNFIENLIAVKREKRTWKIKEFDIAGSSLAGVYNDLRQNLNLNKYVQTTTIGFRFNSAEVDFKNLSPTDKRLLSFSLYKIQKLLNLPRKKKQAFPFGR